MFGKKIPVVLLLLFVFELISISIKGPDMLTVLAVCLTAVAIALRFMGKY